MTMRNTKSLVENDEAIGGGCAFVVVGAIASIFGLIEGQLLTILTLCPCSLPAWSSMAGATLRNACTWAANLITA